MSKFSNVSQISQPSSAVLDFFEQRSFRRLVAILGIGSAVALAYSVFRKHLFPSQSDLDLSSQNIDEASIENANEEGEIQEEQDPRPEVTLYQVPRGFFTPAVSPFGLKLETFLRVAKIDHEVEIINTSTDGTETPWIRVGDKEIKSSLECIKFLSSWYNVDLAAEATSSRKTAARLVDTLFESRISWGVALWRWVYDEGKSVKNVQAMAPTGEWVLSKIRESVVRAANYQGMGKQSEEEVTAIVVQGLVDAAAALGKHQYFLGTSPGEVDCHAFSLLAQMVWNMPGSPFEKTMKEQKTLMDYVLRMRDNYWPDWQELLLQSKPAISAVEVQGSGSTIFSPAALNSSTPSATNNNNDNLYSPPPEMPLRSERSLSRATTPSRSHVRSVPSSSTSTTTTTSPVEEANNKNSQLPPTGQVNTTASAVTSRSSSPAAPSKSKTVPILKKQSANLKTSSSRIPPPPPPTATSYPVSSYSSMPQYIPPPPQHMQTPSYMQAPLGFNNMSPPQPMMMNYPSNTNAQHQQYHTNQRMGSGFVNNNPPMGYSTPIKPSIGSIPRDSSFFDDLQRATAAVMRPMSQERNYNAHINETQAVTNFWQ